MTDKPLEELFGIKDGELVERVEKESLGSDPISHVREAVGPDPVFAIDEDGTQRNPFARDSALLQTVESALDDANRARIEEASKALGFEYIP